jgi:hypothetical protein
MTWYAYFVELGQRLTTQRRRLGVERLDGLADLWNLNEEAMAEIVMAEFWSRETSILRCLSIVQDIQARLIFWVGEGLN